MESDQNKAINQLILIQNESQNKENSIFIGAIPLYFVDNNIEISHHPDHTNDDFYYQCETKIDIARKIPQEFILSNELKQGFARISS